MANPIQRGFSSVHRGIIQLSRGKVGAKMGKAPILLLTTNGRKSGKPRTQPLLYLEDGDALVVVASAGGQPKHPAWYLNLEADPAVEVEIGGAKEPRHARTATPEKHAELWPRLVAIYAGYDKYQAKTEREIPLVILEK
jgi:F420H(2)-dependent quinone reductase